MIAPDKVAEVIWLTTLEKPAHATHWSTRSMAKQMGISDTSVPARVNDYETVGKEVY